MKNYDLAARFCLYSLSFIDVWSCMIEGCWVVGKLSSDLNGGASGFGHR